MARTYYRTFERASGRKVEVTYKARNHPSFTEVEIEKAVDEISGKAVEMTTREREDYEAFIAEHHLEWTDWGQD